MKRFATISTESYLPYTRMLYHSLMQSNPAAELTVFCDSDLYAELFGHNERIRFRVLPSIRKLGVKRAKLDVYLEMSGVPFTYLDSDVIVLEDLSCLFECDMLAGCPDTLEACSFIADREYPWPGDPTLQNRRYLNAGVLFFPSTMRSFIESIRELAQDDECWRRYIIPGHLYDNHFLCAMLNRFDVEFRPLDPYKFGIPGFRDASNWNVTRLGDHLVNQPSGQILHLAHFAYAQDPDYCYARMPAWLAAFLQEKGGIRALNTLPRSVLPSPRLSVTRWIESENGDLVNQIQDDMFLHVLGVCGREIDAILADPSRINRGNDSFFQSPEELQELLYAHNESADVRWKGLMCNRAYLTPLEYEFVEECIRRYAIKSVVESGAGETSVLFRSNGCSVVSIEWQEGPWADRARASGANVHIVPFGFPNNTYAEDQLKSALSGVSSDLLFIDSPVGGERRRGVPEQFLGFIDPGYILVHDVSRDHRNIFEWMRDNGWSLAEYYPSRRGILLLERKRSERSFEPIRIIRSAETAATETEAKAANPRAEGGAGAFAWEMAVLGMLGPFWVSGRYFVPVALVNRSNRDLGSSARINLSYRWRRAEPPNEIVVFDGERSEIHPDLRPGESRRILCEIRAPIEAGRYLIEWDLVEEGVTWFSVKGTVGPLREVDILSAAERLKPVAYQSCTNVISLPHAELRK
jgi:hypothetical protein